MARQRSEPYPALAASVFLHAGVLAAAILLSQMFGAPVHMGDVTTVTLMTSADVANLREAEQAPTPQTAATDTPTPNAPAQATPPPSAPQAQATPPPSPQAKAQTTKPQPDLDLDKLAASLPGARHAANAKPSSAQAGPARAQAGPQATHGTGSGATMSASDMANLQNELMRLWNPNCDVLGGSDVNIVVTFTLNSRGGIQGTVTSSADESHVPMIVAAVDRAKAAVGRAAPYTSLPRGLYGTPIHVNFNAKKACAL